MSETALELARWLPASPERVFAAWTDPASLSRWWGPEGCRVVECSLEVRPGGEWRTIIAAPDGRRWTVSGVYREIAPPRNLAFSWSWDQDDGGRGPETEIVVTFEPDRDGTRLVLKQTGFTTEDARDRHRSGWASSLNDLEHSLSESSSLAQP